MTEIDQAYQGTRAGDESAFAAWVRLVEFPLRRSLRGFARGVDVEAVLQEGLLRMWILAPRLELSGTDASFRYAFRLLRNLALSEARRLGTRILVDPGQAEENFEMWIRPDPQPDPRLRRIILECIEKLPGRPRKALLERLREEGVPDRDRAAALGMKANTFLQNVVRARRLVRVCLEKSGLSLEEVLP